MATSFEHHYPGQGRRMSRLSPVQLLECQPIKISLELSDPADGLALPLPEAQDIGLEFYKHMENCSETETDESDVFAKAYTYLISLGVRSAKGRPYAGLKFEFIFSGRFACTQNFAGNMHRSQTPQEMAYQHGLSILYGSVRESFATLAARMGHPRLCLPVLNFMDEQATQHVPPSAD